MGPHLPPGFRSERPAGGPLISVVTATYNSAATLARTLESVATQRCQDLEHLIIDGGSTDETCALARSGYDKVTVFSEPDRGIYDAFNKGLARAQGELIVILNSDDVFAHSGVTEVVEAAATRRPEIEIFHADLDVVDPGGAVVEPWRFVPRPGSAPDDMCNYLGMANRRQLPHPTAFVRRRLFFRVGGFDTRYRLAGDYDFFQRAFAAMPRIEHIPTVAVKMRNDGASRQQALRAELEVLHSSLANAGFAPLPLLDFTQYHLRRFLGARLRRIREAVRSTPRRS